MSIIQQDLSCRKYLNGIIARVRVDNDYYASLGANMYKHDEINVMSITANISTQLKELHYLISQERKKIDDELVKSSICICMKCERSNASLETRKNHYSGDVK